MVFFFFVCRLVFFRERVRVDKKSVLFEVWNINFDIEKGIFYYLGIFLYFFRDFFV